MVNKSWTDNEILGFIHSDAPEHIIREAWDVLVLKYQDELEEYAFELWGGDDFAVSDTLDRALVTARMWIEASDEIDAVNGNLHQWLRSILRGQFREQSGKEDMARTYPRRFLQEDDDWMEDEFAAFEIEVSS